MRMQIFAVCALVLTVSRLAAADTKNIKLAADAYTDTDPTGSKDTLLCDSDKKFRVLLKPDTSDIAGLDFDEIDDATLQIYFIGNDAYENNKDKITMDVYVLMMDWQESTVTSKCTCKQEWPEDYLTNSKVVSTKYTDSVSFVPQSKGAWVKIDITDAIKYWLDSGNNYGLMLVVSEGTEAGNKLAFRSRESTSNSPFTIVTYTPNSATTTSTPEPQVFESLNFPITADTWTEEGSGASRGSYPLLIVGKHTGWGLKRMLVKADMDKSKFDGYEIVKAYLHLWFVYAHKASWMDEERVARDLHCSRFKIPWSEQYVNYLNRDLQTRWPAGDIRKNTNVIETKEEDIFHVSKNMGKHWSKWEITNLVDDWIVKGDPNHGVLIWAGYNETEEGRDLRYASREYIDKSKRPYIEVLVREPTTTSTETTTTKTTTTISTTTVSTETKTSTSITSTTTATSVTSLTTETTVTTVTTTITTNTETTTTITATTVTVSTTSSTITTKTATTSSTTSKTTTTVATTTLETTMEALTVKPFTTTTDGGNGRVNAATGDKDTSATTTIAIAVIVIVCVLLLLVIVAVVRKRSQGAGASGDVVRNFENPMYAVGEQPTTEGDYSDISATSGYADVPVSSAGAGASSGYMDVAATPNADTQFDGFETEEDEEV